MTRRSDPRDTPPSSPTSSCCSLSSTGTFSDSSASTDDNDSLTTAPPSRHCGSKSSRLPGIAADLAAIEPRSATLRGREMKPADLGPSDPVRQDRRDTFYDPSSADGYGDPSIQNAFLGGGPVQFAAGGGPAGGAAGADANSLDQARLFRERDKEVAAASPFSSPLSLALSPGQQSNHHSESFGSEAVSSPPISVARSTASGFDATSLQTIGQLGQISLDDGSRYAPTFNQDAAETASNSSYYAQSDSRALGPHCGPASYGGAPMSSAPAGLSSFAIDSSAQLNQAAQQQQQPQLTLGIPSVSVSSDIGMDYGPATTVMEAMPSINVMASSPSTPKAGGRQGSNTGFQHLLVQLQAGQGSGGQTGGATVKHEGGSSMWSLEPASYASSSFGDANSTGSGFSPSAAGSPGTFSNGAAELPWSAHQQQPSDGLLKAEPAQDASMTYAELSGSPDRLPYSQRQWSSQAKRKDSYDKIRQFLRLDVDMGFVGGPKFDSPTSSGFRKRATSDVGSRSPIAGLGSDSDWLQALNQIGTAPTFADDNAAGSAQGSADDWQALSKGPGAYAGIRLGGVAPVMTVQLDDVPGQTSTMDPSLLNGGMASSSGGSGSVSAYATDAGDSNTMNYQDPGFTASNSADAGASARPGGGGDFSMAEQQQGSTVTNIGTAPAMRQSLGWQFPMQGTWTDSSSSTAAAAPSHQQHTAGFGAMYPPSQGTHSGRSSAAGHRRAARSEDLSRLGTSGLPLEDFLTRITAPDGGLAPPSTGRSVSGGASNVASTSFYSSASGSSRAHPYRVSHDRHHSWSSNASNSSAASAAGSVSPQPPTSFSSLNSHLGAGPEDVANYSATALPTYGSVSGRSASVTSSIGSPGSNSHMSAPVVPVVTSQATQVASASRRKGEALFSCPVPGCGSTFTRQYNLRGHLRSHADERPFKCEWPGCGKSFARAHDCKRHQNLHLNIKPHTCEHCGKTFARLDALNRHHKTDNGGCFTKFSDGSDDDEASMTSTSDARGGGEPGQPCHADHNSATAGSSKGKGFGGHVL